MTKIGDATRVLVMLFIIVLVLAAICLARPLSRFCFGGKPPLKPTQARSPHIVIDTLNLAYWLRDAKISNTGRAQEKGNKLLPLSVSEIVTAIDATAATLKKKHPGRVMYVLKDRESQLNSEFAHEEYMKCADRNRVYVIIAEKYADPPRGNARSVAHSASGRDDFLIAVLASRWKCAALTEDRLRDFSEFQSTLQPFYAIELAYWRVRAAREFFRPESAAYTRLRKPRTVRFAEYF